MGTFIILCFIWALALVYKGILFPYDNYLINELEKDQKDKDAIKLIKMYTDRGVLPEKIIFTEDCIAASWNITKNQIRKIGNTHHIKHNEKTGEKELKEDFTTLVFYTRYDELSDELVDKINNSKGIIVYMHAKNYEFCFIPTRNKPEILEVKPPDIVRTDNNTYTIMTCGSIENGKAELWASKIVNTLKEEIKPELDVVIYNPRRDNWDPNWTQSIDNKQFSEQVEWELDHIEKSDLIVMYLLPGTMSPISMLELGLVAERVFCMKKDMIVLCPDGFYRKGNIDIVCQYYDISMASDMDDLIKKIKEKISNAPADKKAKQYFDSLYEDNILEE